MPRISWENNVLGFVPRKDWLDVPFQVTRPDDPADRLLNDDKTDNIIAEWDSIASMYQIPVMAQFHGFDTESQKTFRVPVDNHNIEKGLIKVKINQSERLRALLRNGVQNDSAIYDYVINDGVRLAEQVVTRTKVAKNELLAYGNITIHENNLDLTVDYGVPEANKSLTIDVGAGASSDLTAQFQSIVDQAREAGVVITGMYTSNAFLSKCRGNAAFQKAINGTSAIGATVRRTAFEEYMSEEYGINEIITNDLTYGADYTIDQYNRPQVTLERYYPKNKVTFFARTVGREIGTGLWGDPPEIDVANLLDVNGSSESPYVYITQWAENDPSVLWTKASSLFMPVLYNPNGLYIADVTETSGE